MNFTTNGIEFLKFEVLVSPVKMIRFIQLFR